MSDKPIDPQSVWQNQQEEEERVSIQEIRSWARELQKKYRREYLIGAMVLVLLVAMSTGKAAQTADVWHRGALIAAAAVSSIALALHYLILRKAHLPLNAGQEDCIEFLRKELQLRRTYLSKQWLFPLPAFLFTAAMAGPGFVYVFQTGRWQPVAPFLVLLAIWIVGAVTQSRRRWAELDAEMRDLESLRR